MVRSRMVRFLFYNNVDQIGGRIRLVGKLSIRMVGMFL